MPCCKPKRQTTYHQRYNALSALELHTIGKVQHIWTLCVLHLKMIEQLFVVCLLMELDDDNDLIVMLMLLLHHLLECIHFFSLLDNLLLEITADQVIPHLVPANLIKSCHDHTIFLSMWPYVPTCPVKVHTS
jgi:hypothetical protein